MTQPAYIPTEPLSANQQEMLADALEGLSQQQKTLPCKYFYDEEGSRIFDEITGLPEYYPTRTEAEIMRAHGKDIAAALGENVLLVEYGSGSSEKTRILLDSMQNMAGYVPVDISGDYLTGVAAQLQSEYPHIPVSPVTADFTEPFELPELDAKPHRIVAYFPGSTIGNFEVEDAKRILAQMTALCGPDGAVLIGVDLVKPVDILLAAYNDSAGVTARFNMNLLHRLNSELEADFDASQFRHEAIFNTAQSRIEMHLFSKEKQTACIDGIRFHFEEGESILTEYSHKYSPEAFAALAASAGLAPQKVWTDANDLFSVQYLTPANTK